MGANAMRKPHYTRGAGAIGWGVAAVVPLAVIGVAVSAAGVAALPLILVAAAAGVAIGALAFYLLSPGWARLVLVMGFLGGITMLGLQESRFLGAMPVGLVTAASGGILGAHLRYLADRRTGATPSGTDGTSLRIEWRTGRKVFEEVGATPGSLEQKIGSLDGKTTTVVSALRGTARLDICGNAAGPLVVFHCPDTADEDQWSLLTSAEADPSSVDVVIGELKGTYLKSETVGMDVALRAARQFAATGEADASLSWRASPDVFDRRPLPA